MSIIVLGTVALDSVKTPHGRRNNLLGGSAAHFAMSARFFNEVNLVAIVGEDFPRKHIDFLHKNGIILTSLIKSGGKTFRWSGEYKGDLNTALTLSTELGVLSFFKPKITDHQRKIENVFLANVDPEIQSHLLKSMHSPRLVGLDSMNYWIHNKRKALFKLLKLVDIYVANDQEARDLSGEHNLIKAARYLRGKGPRFIVIKKGEHGVLFYCDRFIFSYPAFPVEKVVDPTGAGDTFAGGFMGYLSVQKSISEKILKRAVIYGTILSSFNVEGFGLEKTSVLTKKAVNSRLNKFKKILAF
ncbi:MAG: sugar kinase [Candidatus Omnitrophica bacterium CG11_big_fil_rev_8_21_14_0_20_42_13]|uniref:Sugar kinase n=1 Tax=Candidatus Ghiorseimicrobium undicola TaxID=1974746 RepID=A0A2H0LV02_9BACT|nr:MAG: sugar kinase [Candidatus Omnitrophica bacterium CG11_big_fil_rev_8_21_14_0_20_42_13]